VGPVNLPAVVLAKCNDTDEVLEPGGGITYIAGSALLSPAIFRRREMKMLGCVLAIALAGWAARADAQCRGQRLYYGRPVYAGPPYAGPPYAGMSPYGTSPYSGSGYYRGPYTAGYAGYAAYSVNSPFYARRPSYPEASSATVAPRYGQQTTYFRAPPGAYAPPGSTFFGGYDYRVTYPTDWYAGNWTWW